LPGHDAYSGATGNTQRKRGVTDRPEQRGTAPALDPTWGPGQLPTQGDPANFFCCYAATSAANRAINPTANNNGTVDVPRLSTWVSGRERGRNPGRCRLA